MKKTFSLILVLLLCMTLAVPALAVGGSCGEDVSWTLDTSTGVLTISGSGPMTNYSTYGAWYDRRGDIVTTVIESGVTSIGRRNFYGCGRLTNITISDTVTVIGDMAFYGCGGLRSITIPSSVTAIGRSAFYGVTELDVYYGGTKEMWDSILIGEWNGDLKSATFHYAGETAPAEESTPVVQHNPQDIPATGTAYVSTQTVELDGKTITLPAYALKDASGNPTNYVRLRDLATLLNGTAAQFDVTWDAVSGIELTSKHSYDNPNGSEGQVPFFGDQSYTAYTVDTAVDGTPQSLTAFQITYQGGGHTYYQLRDLGRALGFNVGWSAERGIFIETDKAYTDAD